MHNPAIIFLSANHKRLLFQNIRNIAHLRNSHGKKYTFRDHLSSKRIEFNKKGQAIANVVGERDAVDQEEVVIEKSDIYVGEKKYIKQIEEPDPTAVLQMPMSRLNQVMMTPLQRARAVLEDQNKFTAYSLCTNNYRTAQDAYMQIRLNHAEARHIVCAWYIPSQNDYEDIDWCDDDEYGAGAAVANVLKENKITHRVVYIVRNCGQKLNKKRLPLYQSVAKKLLQQYPENPICGKTQLIEDKPYDEMRQETYARAVQQGSKKKDHPIHRGRGQGRRGHGRGRGRGGFAHRNTENEEHRNNNPNKGRLRPVETYMPKKYSSEQRETYSFSDPINKHLTQGDRDNAVD